MTRFSERFLNRQDAGRQLADHLTAFAERPDVVVVALPRGGVPVAAEIASALGAPLDVCVVRKLGMPGQPELAIGAIAEGGLQIRHRALIDQVGLSTTDVDAIAARELAEVGRRVVLFRDGQPRHPLRGHTVILVDDGLATGATMEAALASVRRQEPTKVIVAVPVGAAEACRRFRASADEVLCLSCPESFLAVGQWYEDFDQTTDGEVIRLLQHQSR